MGSSGKKKTTMAKRARENRLRERRLDKQARKDARKQASSENLDAADASMEAGGGQPAAQDSLSAGFPTDDHPGSAPGYPDAELAAPGPLDTAPYDTRDKEVARRGHPDHGA